MYTGSTQHGNGSPSTKLSGPITPPLGCSVLKSVKHSSFLTPSPVVTTSQLVPHTAPRVSTPLKWPHSPKTRLLSGRWRKSVVPVTPSPSFPQLLSTWKPPMVLTSPKNTPPLQLPSHKPPSMVTLEAPLLSTSSPHPWTLHGVRPTTWQTLPLLEPLPLTSSPRPAQVPTPISPEVSKHRVTKIVIASREVANGYSSPKPTELSLCQRSLWLPAVPLDCWVWETIIPWVPMTVPHRPTRLTLSCWSKTGSSPTRDLSSKSKKFIYKKEERSGAYIFHLEWFFPNILTILYYSINTTFEINGIYIWKIEYSKHMCIFHNVNR